MEDVFVKGPRGVVALGITFGRNVWEGFKAMAKRGKEVSRTGYSDGEGVAVVLLDKPHEIHGVVESRVALKDI